MWLALPVCDKEKSAHEFTGKNLLRNGLSLKVNATLNEDQQKRTRQEYLPFLGGAAFSFNTSATRVHDSEERISRKTEFRSPEGKADRRQGWPPPFCFLFLSKISRVQTEEKGKSILRNDRVHA